MTRAQSVLGMLEKKDKLILPRYTYSYNHPRSKDDTDPVKVDNKPQYDKYKAGDNITFDAGAPGIGKVTYKITRIDNKGVWGIEISNTIRVPGE